jgi:hypothetical protein
MTALALAIAFLGCLAFAAYVLWLRRQDVPPSEVTRVDFDAVMMLVNGLAAANTANLKRLAAAEETLSTLSLKAGLTRNDKARA